MLNSFFGDSDKKQAVSWAFFDFANSAYFMIIISFIFPIYYKEVIVGHQFGDLYWGLIIGISILFGAIISPFIGAMTDYDHKRKFKFIVFTILCILGTAALYFTGPNTIILASLLFIIANLCYEVAIVLYDAFLVDIVPEHLRGRISGLGYGLGYLGGIAAILIVKPFIINGINNLIFPVTALFFFIFAIPLFIFLKEKPKTVEVPIFKASFKNVINTLSNIKKNKNVFLFILGFHFLSDAIVTIFAFVSIYATNTLNISIPELIKILIIIQIIAFPSTIIFGWLSDKYGQKNLLITTLVIWSINTLLIALVYSVQMFYIIAVISGMVVGSAQAIARSWFAKIVPKEKRYEFFGFNGFSSKVSAIIGPIIFGLISAFTGNQRIAVFAMLPFFLVSIYIFSKIKE